VVGCSVGSQGLGWWFGGKGLGWKSVRWKGVECLPGVG